MITEPSAAIKPTTFAQSSTAAPVGIVIPTNSLLTLNAEPKGIKVAIRPPLLSLTALEIDVVPTTRPSRPTITDGSITPPTTLSKVSYITVSVKDFAETAFPCKTVPSPMTLPTTDKSNPKAIPAGTAPPTIALFLSTIRKLVVKVFVSITPSTSAKVVAFGKICPVTLPCSFNAKPCPITLPKMLLFLSIKVVPITIPTSEPFPSRTTPSKAMAPNTFPF